ncbi:DUF5925 domain-containing protein [Mycolicibacter sinensis]|uniref:AAA+ ATPase domain-containing protein n=1 Tax=Mycolicibacter sinensis (strain JDM601) TaxID=875328 RepID=A0A1A2XYT3_MYCSD|nr:DUF5925 domain-containing protein [Mycolicibacter sinensis]OBH19503.1 hypothetical protein A5694_18640 [Mycolicibacter sinensis]OBI30919.1 hypothetical protein A5710_19220 [Mycolicibacter sinensis]
MTGTITPAVPVHGVHHEIRGFDGHIQTMEAAFHTNVLDGTQPFVRAVTVTRATESTLQLPPDLLVERRWRLPRSTHVLARTADASVLLEFRDQSVSVKVSADRMERADEIAEAFVAQKGTPRSSETVTLKMVASTDIGVRTRRNDIEAPAWEDIARNYPADVERRLADLVGLDGPGSRGRLVLWHGPPGTGKSTALRALARKWRSWCDTVYVVDPEQMFRNAGYLLEVLSGEPSERENTPRWQLIIAEDTDEYLRVTARQDAGAALGRLLNVTDGILGQGMRTIILLTTNEDISKLHPALTRPGRCLAEVGFQKFTVAQARAWLPADAPAPTAPSSLAELYERLGTNSRISTAPTQEPSNTGMYL